MKTLILVDIQNDFLPGGSLAVPNGDQVIPVANEVQSQFDLVLATQDWHPANHASFAANHRGKQPGETIELGGLPQILWPTHCVQDTAAAEFAEQLNTQAFDRVIRKGTDPHIDSYSGFFDNGKKKSTGLADYLKQQQVEEVTVMGLATDYCVKFTALDAVELGIVTNLLVAGCRGVDLQPGDCERAIAEMQAAGIHLV